MLIYIYVGQKREIGREITEAKIERQIVRYSEMATVKDRDRLIDKWRDREREREREKERERERERERENCLVFLADFCVGF